MAWFCLLLYSRYLVQYLIIGIQLKNKYLAGGWGGRSLTPVILATQKAGIRRITTQGPPGQKSRPISKYPTQKKG
jgi:hypothetical protein